MFSHPPDVVCPHCRHSDPQFEFEPVSGNGSVCSWIVVRQSFLPGFDADIPFVLVDVALSDHPEIRLIGRLLDGVDAPLGIGALVEVAFESLSDGSRVPAFTLAEPS